MNFKLSNYIQFNQVKEIQEYFSYIQFNQQKEIKEYFSQEVNKEELQQALSYAAHESKIDIVKCLVGLGADVSANDNHALRGAALIKSAEYGNLEVIEYLVENGADIEAIKNTSHPIVKQWVEAKVATQGEKPKSKNKL